MSSALFDQVEQKCNLEPIRELLRDIKGRSEEASREILLSGTKKDAVRYLALAVEKHFCGLDEVYEMLRRSEETGHQHILLLCLAPDADSPPNMHPDVVASNLFEHPVSEIFPRVEYPSDGYAWSDFRYNLSVGTDWIAKAYGREVYKASVDTRVEDLGDGKFQEIREYEYREAKTVLVAKWYSNAGIMELRIDNSQLQTTTAILDRQRAFWRLFEPAFRKEDFVGLNVDKLLHHLVFEREEPRNQSRYSISRVELTDPRSGQIKVVPYQSEAFDKDPGRKKALEAMESSKFVPWSVRLDWKADADGTPPTMTESIPTVVEKTDNGPELRIQKKIPREVYEYVFGQIRSRLE